MANVKIINEKNGCSERRRYNSQGIAGLALLALGFVAISPAHAASLSLGAAGGYGLVSLGNGTANSASFKMNSGPLAGDVLVGQGTKIDFSGGGNGEITGNLNYDTTTIGAPAEFDDLAVPVANPVVVSTSFTQNAFNDAVAASNTYSSLTATQTFGQLQGATITADRFVNVINATGIKNELTLDAQGDPNSIFVFNVSGQFDSNRQMTLLNGAQASNIIFNMTGTGTVFKTAGGNLLYGTFLATNGGDFQFSNLALTGALINTSGHIQFVSGSKLTSDAFSPVPIPAAAWLFGSALAGLVAFGRRKRAKTASI